MNRRQLFLLLWIFVLLPTAVLATPCSDHTDCTDPEEPVCDGFVCISCCGHEEIVCPTEVCTWDPTADGGLGDCLNTPGVECADPIPEIPTRSHNWLFILLAAVAGAVPVILSQRKRTPR